MRQGLTLALAVALLSVASAAEEPDSLRPFRSSQWGFCLSYPAQWKMAPLFGGEMMQLTAPNASGSEIRFGAFRNHKNSEPSNVPKSLPEIADDALDNIKDQMVKDLRVENRPTRLGGEPGLITLISYRKDGVPWREKHVRVRRSDEVIIELQLIAPLSDNTAMEPAFDRIVQHTFQPRCSKQTIAKTLSQ